VRKYDPSPSYRPAGGEVEHGWPAAGNGVLAIDGPSAVPWDEVAAVYGGVDISGCRAPEPAQLDDPAFERVPTGTLAERLQHLPQGAHVVCGPGAALVPHDELWYADLPRRLHRTDDERRMHYVDWPLESRHRRELLPRIDRYLDLSAGPRSVTGAALRATLGALAVRPFRVRPAFLPGPWGGQWLRGMIGIETDAPNLAWSYELITPEAGLLLDGLEVAFDLLLAQEADAVVGRDVAARFGGEFPIRFDYLDTLGGGNLSIQCHPQERYAREVFGLKYTQSETYYVVETTPGAEVFLGLRENADVQAFAAAARDALEGREFDPATYVRTHPVEQHRLYLIPPGTVHASGAGSVVLEVSATPYLYTLRFYDWLRRGLDGKLRPVHLGHAFANLDPTRHADELIREPRTVRPGEIDLGSHPELFYGVHRLEFDGSIDDDTGGRFHVLCLVDGEHAVIETDNEHHQLAYGETIVVPAAVGRYRIVGAGRAVKAFVR
jgi:mannose-6-phosphate isomerase class I